MEIVAKEGKFPTWQLKFQGFYNSKNNNINSKTIIFFKEKRVHNAFEHHTFCGAKSKY